LLTPEIEIKDQKYLEILKSTDFIFRIIDLILAMTLFVGKRLTLHKSQVHSYGVVQ